MPGKLTVCPTPIGNLGDITGRVRNALAEADLIACEDTRRAGRLLELLELPAPRLVSYHEQNEADRARELARVLQSPETVVAFESPRRLPESLAALATLAPDRPAAVCRELTKLHEEVARGTLGELMRRFRDDLRGEIVLVIGPARETASTDIGFAVDALRGLVLAGARPRAAASIVSALTGVPANELYRGITGRDPRR